MTEHLIIGIASIVILGVGAQWLAWRFRLPSILLLLIFGFAAGPATGFLDPDALFGDLLLPLVSFSVSIILFEGGLSLKLSELWEVGRVVRNLITIGVLLTWLLSSAIAYLVLDLSFPLATLLGAILVVTGPTVIGPLLKHVRPVSRIDSIIKWEGIVNDPIGAILAILVFKAITASGGVEESTALAAVGILKAVLIGFGVGFLGARIMIALLKHYWVPDFLQNPISLAMVIAVFTVSDSLQEESGLLAVTIMGVILANQSAVSIRHIIEFKENLRVLFISGLFIILAARLPLSALAYINFSSLAFLGALILFVRPLAVVLSTLGSGLSWQERAFLAWMAPRGIVAAAVSSVFALNLEEAGNAQAEQLVPVTFLVIVGTVTVYGLSASPVARRLGLAKPNPQGCLILGAHPWACDIASAVREYGYQVLLVDSNWANIASARKMGLPTFHANILSKFVLDKIKLDGIGHLLAMTPNDEVNSLAALHFIEVFGRSEVYQLSPHVEERGGKKEDTIPEHLRGRILFGPARTYPYLTDFFENGAVIKKTHLTEEFDYNAFQLLHGDTAIPLLLINESGGELTVYAADNVPTPKPGQILVSLVNAAKKTR